MRLSVDNALSTQKDKQTENKETPEETKDERTFYKWNSNSCDTWDTIDSQGRLVRRERYEPFH